jgi:DNA-directed RNA polymerase specialized sigma24 family protein
MVRIREDVKRYLLSKHFQEADADVAAGEGALQVCRKPAEYFGPVLPPGPYQVTWGSPAGKNYLSPLEDGYAGPADATFEGYREAYTNIKNYWLKVAKNAAYEEARNRLRAGSADDALLQTAVSGGGPHPAEVREVRSRLLAAVCGLPAREREMAHLYYDHAGKLEEIGRQYGCHKSKVSRTVKTVRLHVASWLRKEGLARADERLADSLLANLGVFCARESCTRDWLADVLAGRPAEAVAAAHLYYAHDRPVEEIAGAQRRTPDAVRQDCAAVRDAVRGALVERGWEGLTERNTENLLDGMRNFCVIVGCDAAWER